jgi:hypothetical protein
MSRVSALTLSPVGFGPARRQGPVGIAFGNAHHFRVYPREGK